jgi:hypothetical protein
MLKGNISTMCGDGTLFIEHCPRSQRYALHKVTEIVVRFRTGIANILWSASGPGHFNREEKTFGMRCIGDSVGSAALEKRSQ